jgi:hypothetical protein
MRWMLFAAAMLASALSLAIAADPSAGDRPAGDPPRTDPVVVHTAAVTVRRQSFDPRHPPDEMPRLTPPETAICVGEFSSSANVGGRAARTGDTHATVTIDRIEIALRLNITIWTPHNAPRRVVDHEEGHRLISEHYYKNAADLARRIAEPYVGKKIKLDTPHFQADFKKLLQATASQITSDYNRQLSVEPAQTLYDRITDHSRNEIPFRDAIEQAIRQASSPATQPAN